MTVPHDLHLLRLSAIWEIAGWPLPAPYGHVGAPLPHLEQDHHHDLADFVSSLPQAGESMPNFHLPFDKNET